jgi:hypothetical protein
MIVLQVGLAVVGEPGSFHQGLLLRQEAALGERVPAVRARSVAALHRQAPPEVMMVGRDAGQVEEGWKRVDELNDAVEPLSGRGPGPEMISGSRVMQSCIADGNFSISPKSPRYSP